MNEITDSDLNLRADRDDRLQTSIDDEAVVVPAASGGAALKSIFAPANRKRLVMYAGAGLLLSLAILYTFFSVSEEDAARQQIGAGSQATSRVTTQSGGAGNTWMAQEARETYNQTVLPEIQKEDPFAHPLLDVTESPRRAGEELPNPFVEDEDPGPPQRLSEAVAPRNEDAYYSDNSAGRRAGRGDIQTADIDALVEGLIAAEGERQPVMQRVSWSYVEPAAPAAATPLAGGTVMDEPGVEDTLNQAATSLCTKPLARAGTQHMATADIALNSDVGGPVAFTVRNGPLRNATLLGAFERVEKWVRINLNRVVLPDETLSISAIALDIDTSLNAVEGDIDRHLMYRYGWWGLGTTLRAIGKAAETNADTEIYVSDGVAIQSSTRDSAREIKLALGELGQELGEVMRDRINRPVTISLKVGDEVGVFVLEDICSSAGSRGRG